MIRGRTILVVLALAALTVAVYAPVGHFDFVQLDDPAYVTENPNVLGGLTLEGLSWAFTTGHAANWHPVTWLSHMLDVQLFGVAAGAHHLTSLALHAANTLLLFGLLVLLTGALWRSALVAALFAVHPLHVESVAWVAERKDVLSTFFMLLTLWAYAGFVRHVGPAATAGGATAGRSRRVYYALMLVVFALGLMAKPMLVTLPFVLLLLDVWPLERLNPAWPRVREKLPLFVMAAASSIVTFVVQQRGGAVTPFEVHPFSLRLQNAVVSVVAYLRDALWPAGLTVLYSFPSAVPPEQVAISLAVLAVVSLAAYRLARREPYLLVGWLWYLGTLVPVAGLVQVGVQARADRYTYVPLIGVFIMVAWGLAALVGRRPRLRMVVSAAAIGAIVGCAVTARVQAGYWTDSVALWTRATMITLHVDEFEAHMSLGTALGNQGRVDEAREHFAEAARLRPESDAAHCSLGIALARSGRLTDAVRELNEALRLNPGNQAARRALDGLSRRDQF
jgi:protein O-mannosyl-transferase